MIPPLNEKKKRVSKKNKSSWRKHIDTKDVDDFLEEQRLEQRLGEPFAILKDEQLFTVDTAPNEKQLSAKEKKRLRLLAPPKCFSMLESHSKVPDPITKRNRVRTKEERKCPILKRKEIERKRNGILKYREKQRIDDKKKHDEKLKEAENDEFSKDIWEIEDKLGGDEWIDKVTKRHTLRGTGKLNKIIPRMQTGKNKHVSNIETPHPGISYNPSFKDHNDLLVDIAEKEAKIIKEEKHLNRVTKDVFKRVAAEENSASWLKEMSQGLPNDEDHNEEIEEDLSGKPYKSVNPPVENKKKTEKQRRKQKEQILLKESRLLAKQEKKKTVDLHKLKLIKAQIENREKKLQKQKQRKEKLKMFKSKEPKQLGRLKYEEPDMVFSMREDLTGNLRNLRTQGSLLTDRFRSLQKRNILAVTARQNHKKAKVKKFVKPGFNDNWKKSVANINISPTMK
ncbi:glioma suppressor candidate [Holotrichia oblita]|uniref:Glioma suppressor candidate n=1 Tax=Holotrichia oblita TaxID=644536 RepID=A0ACB9SVD5_HOLOL|nr:glioma suppressor candidate [Holotrichia oblita]